MGSFRKIVRKAFQMTHSWDDVVQWLGLLQLQQMQRAILGSALVPLGPQPSLAFIRPRNGARVQKFCTMPQQCSLVSVPIGLAYSVLGCTSTVARPALGAQLLGMVTGGCWSHMADTEQE